MLPESSPCSKFGKVHPLLTSPPVCLTSLSTYHVVIVAQLFQRKLHGDLEYPAISPENKELHLHSPWAKMEFRDYNVATLLLSNLHSLYSNVHNCPSRVPYSNSSSGPGPDPESYGALSQHMAGEVTRQRTGEVLLLTPRDKVLLPHLWVSFPVFSSGLCSVVELLGVLEAIFPRKSFGSNFPAHVTDLMSWAPRGL